MARKYIKIRDVTDIDVSQIGVGNIENRYIDAEGNRYATRFNKRTRKIDIVRIALGREEAQLAQMKIRGVPRKRESEQEEVSSQPTEHPSPYQLPGWISSRGISPASNLQVREYLNELEKECNRISERFRGVISNLKTAEVQISSEEQHQDFILDITTSYERDIQNPLTETQNLVIEMARFPKPNSHYLSYLERPHKTYFDSLNLESQTEYLKALVIGKTFLKALEGGLDLIDFLNNRLSAYNAGQLRDKRKQAYENATQSITFIESSLITETAKVLKWFSETQLI